MNTLGTTFAFEPGQNARTNQSPPPSPTPLPDREWGLSARQVVAVVLAIIAACELIGLLIEKSA